MTFVKYLFIDKRKEAHNHFNDIESNYTFDVKCLEWALIAFVSTVVGTGLFYTLKNIDYSALLSSRLTSEYNPRQNNDNYEPPSGEITRRYNPKTGGLDIFLLQNKKTKER